MIVRKQEAEHISFDGLGILDHTASLADNAASMATIEIPPGAAHAQSWSKRSDKYYLVIHGGVRFTLDNEAFDLEAGDFLLVKQGRKFSYRNVHAEPAKLVLVHTPPFDLDFEVFD
jgi:mannose-6-phosphate isomerase-like protein (cupin superfamily)